MFAVFLVVARSLLLLTRLLADHAAILIDLIS